MTAKSKRNSNSKPKDKSAEFNRVDTLMITVGTRQIGWRCQDGVVRCLGTDGRGDIPPHTDELYKELGILERGCHQQGDRNSRWGVRDLGERYYKHCQETLGANFGAVELLLDGQIVTKCVQQQALKHIILWATNQPESVSWQYRRSDTLWLAELMRGKIESIWPNKVKNNQLKVEVWQPVIDASDGEVIRQTLEAFLLQYVLNLPNTVDKDKFTLMIENKGAVPDIAESLAICAAALVKEFQVLKAIPKEPNPSYEEQPTGAKIACTSTDFQTISIGQSFWPLERSRVIVAWEQGDFREAKFWLSSHQNRYGGLLYQLAEKLALSINRDVYNFLHNSDKGIESWLQSAAKIPEIAEPALVGAWQEQLCRSRSSRSAEAWEACFLVYLLLRRENYTDACMQFAQTLERLLYIHYQTGDWEQKSYITLSINNSGKKQEPSFRQLIEAWSKLNSYRLEHKWPKLLDRIREKRNEIVHKAEPITPGQVQALWSQDGLFSVKITGNYTQDIMLLMMKVLKEVCDPTWKIPEQPLLQSLYEWGLKLLRQESVFRS